MELISHKLFLKILMDVFFHGLVQQRHPRDKQNKQPSSQGFGTSLQGCFWLPESVVFESFVKPNWQLRLGWTEN